MDGLFASRSPVALHKDRDGRICDSPPSIQYLLWRDAFDVTQMIFGNPIFHQHMSLDLHEVYMRHDGHKYGKWMSSKEAFRIQVGQPYPCSLYMLIMSSGSTSHWCHHCSYYSCFRQNPRYKTDWRPRNAPPFPDNRQHSLWYTHESNSPCLVLHCIYAHSSIHCT